MMESEIYNALKQAADLIRAGEKKAAREILVKILRDAPDSAQAWFMLSYAAQKTDKKIYALQQTLRLAPDYEKALNRLEKLGGEPPATDPFSTPEVPAPDPETEADDESDLLSQRLFGAPEKEKASKPPAERKPIQPFVETEPDEMENSENYFEDKKVSVMDSIKKLQTDIEESEKIRPINDFLEKLIARISRIPPRVAFITLFVVVLVILGIIYGPGLYQSLTSGRIAQVIRESLTGERDQLDETIGATPTENVPTPTPNPSPTPVILQLFNTSDLFPASGGVLAEMEGIMTGIDAMVGSTAGTAPAIYPLTESRLQGFAWDFAQIEGVEDQAETAQMLYQILGTARDTDDFAAFYQNIWIDPNGTLYQPEEDFIAVVGFELSDYQKISFAQAYVQSIRNRQVAFADSGFFPPCIIPTEACEIRMALAKGDAVFTASEWARKTYGEETFQQMVASNKKLYITPVLSPTILMEDLRTFPYDEGSNFVDQIYQSGGWVTVQSLYINLPQTTEQILHPEKYLQGETGSSIDFTNVETLVPETWQVLYAGPLGEWKTYLIFKDSIFPNARIDPEAAQTAAAGWNGDYAQVFVEESGNRLLVGHWKWDTAGDAAEFEIALGNYVNARVGGPPVDLGGYSCIQSTIETSCVVSKGQDVVWFFSQDADLIATIMESYTFLSAE